MKPLYETHDLETVLIVFKKNIAELKKWLEDGWSLNYALRKAGITQQYHTMLLKDPEYNALSANYRTKNSSFTSVTLAKLEREKELRMRIEKKIVYNTLNKLKMRTVK